MDTSSTILDPRTDPDPRGAGVGPAPGSYRSALMARLDAVLPVAADRAGAVDREGCFPEDAFAALRAQRLLGIMIPADLGGEGASVSDVADICYRLGQVCSSTAMIYAMHQACLACVIRHGRAQPWHRALLRHAAAEQLLIASSTTEGQGGGNVRASAAPVEYGADSIRLERAATVISYGARADALVTTARRSGDAAAADQVLVAFLRADYVLEPTVGWDSLGMRGTCSAGYRLIAGGRPEQILPEPYERIHSQSMVPVSHLAWAATWAGIAAGAVERARAYVRHAARHNGGTMPPGAVHFTKAAASLRTLRGLIATSLRAYEAIADDGAALAALDFQATMNLTKVEASELAVAIVLTTAQICGLAGYRNDSEFSIGRPLRDILSSPIMISNDRILRNLSGTMLMTADPATLG